MPGIVMQYSEYGNLWGCCEAGDARPKRGGTIANNCLVPEALL